MRLSKTRALLLRTDFILWCNEKDNMTEISRERKKWVETDGSNTVASLQLTSVNLRRHQSVTDAPSFLSTRRLLSRTINTVRACSTSGSADTGPA